MDGCLANMVKYLLFATNFVVFILGLVVLGVGIWVKVDSPSFLDLFEQADNVLDEGGNFDISIYTSAALILIIVSSIVVIVTFFGCCGAIKESRCMLGTYFAIILALFIVLIVGAVIGYAGNFEESIKQPLLDSMAKYRDTPAQDKPQEEAYKKVWNEVQDELRCCGVNNMTDWKTHAPDAGFTVPFNKPEGCCRHKADGTEIKGDTEIGLCRASTDYKMYNFNGCFTKFEEEINKNQEVLIGVAIGVVVVMFLNMLFAFAMCTMAR